MALSISPNRTVSPAPILALAALFALAAIAVAAPALPRLADIPMTQHAMSAHAHQSINATRLVNDINGGKCRDMQVYNCEAEETIKIGCAYGPRIVGMLVIGLASADPQIVTGYGSRRSYFDGNTSDCTPLGGLPFALP